MSIATFQDYYAGTFFHNLIGKSSKPTSSVNTRPNQNSSYSRDSSTFPTTLPGINPNGSSLSEAVTLPKAKDSNSSKTIEDISWGKYTQSSPESSPPREIITGMLPSALGKMIFDGGEKLRAETVKLSQQYNDFSAQQLAAGKNLSNIMEIGSQEAANQVRDDFKAFLVDNGQKELTSSSLFKGDFNPEISGERSS